MVDGAAVDVVVVVVVDPRRRSMVRLVGTLEGAAVVVVVVVVVDGSGISVVDIGSGEVSASGEFRRDEI